MPIEHLHAPGMLVPLTFDPAADLLGTGTVAEVFQVTLEKHQIEALTVASDEPTNYALKRYFNRSGRDDFANERDILKALSIFPHAHIVSCISSWTFQDVSYMLFPLANGDLYHLLRNTAPPKLTTKFATWLLEQTTGLCDAIKYLHDYESPDIGPSNKLYTMRRIGFHHDLKPANILLYGADTNSTVWKLGDFGSGAIKYVSSTSRESIYNRKASTGDPIYSAPEYVVEGKVSRPKDIWSLGCIFLEVLIWALDRSNGVIDLFEQERVDFSNDSPDQAPTYWCLDLDGLPCLNPAVVVRLKVVHELCKETGLFESILETIHQMLAICPRSRPTAVELYQQFQTMKQKTQPHPDSLQDTTSKIPG